MNIEPTILRKKIEDLREVGAFHSHWSQHRSDLAEGRVGRHYGVYRNRLLDLPLSPDRNSVRARPEFRLQLFALWFTRAF